jgi:hypothetical protein
MMSATKFLAILILLIVAQSSCLLSTKSPFQARAIGRETLRLESSSETVQTELDEETRSPRPKGSPTHRSTAVFALQERRISSFPIRQLEKDQNYVELDRRDRAFARLMLSTAERRKGQIDKVLHSFMRESHEFKKVNAVWFIGSKVVSLFWSCACMLSYLLKRYRLEIATCSVRQPCELVPCRYCF